MSSVEAVYDRVCDHVRETKLLGSIAALLDWDQQTGMPKQAGDYRAEQSTWLAGRIHERDTAPELGEWLEILGDSELTAEHHSETAATVRELKYRFDKKRRLPLDLVQRQAALHSRGQQIWLRARKEDDFQIFEATLAEIFQLKREEAQATSDSDCLYDALLDDYEPGARTDQVATALQELKTALIPLIAEAREAHRPADGEVLHRHYPIAAQKEFVREATAAIGFDYDRGRLDVAHHPFCTEIGPDDCRITTRYDESFFSSAFFGCLHEAGHGMYEQGLRKSRYGLPAGSYCSLGIHESQSRLWENLVGRSTGFWAHFIDKARGYFPSALDGCTESQFCQAINQIQPSLIRVEADEATYNLHIIVRFELEQALLNDDLTVHDLPGAWNEKYQDSLGISAPSAADGLLQDIHWSAGLVGYFPTYSLGNIYASQLFEQAGNDLGDLNAMFAGGHYRALHQWLVSKVHRAGNCYRAHELMQHVTGSAIDHVPLVRHLKQKTGRLCSSD